MPSPQHFLNYLHAFLSKPGVSSSAPLSLLLIGLALLIEPKLLCPCRHERNASLITFIFIGPAFFTFALMCALLSENKNDDTQSSAGRNNADGTQSKSLGERFLYCLIPPVIWIIILLIDGDYLACGMTTWEGLYVFDKEMEIKWCQPTEQAGNRTDFRLKNQKIIWGSQLSGYVLIFLFSVLILGIVVYRECHQKNDVAQDGTQTKTKRTESGSHSKVHDEETQNEVDDVQNRAGNDAQCIVENRPQIEIKPLLSRTAQEADSPI